MHNPQFSHNGRMTLLLEYALTHPTNNKTAFYYLDPHYT